MHSPRTMNRVTVASLTRPRSASRSGRLAGHQSEVSSHSPARSGRRPRRSGAGRPRPRPRWCSAPRLKRTEERRRSSGTRMACRVGEGRVAPLAQAEPSEAETPARSSCIRRASPSRPGKPTFRVWGSRNARVGRAVADDAIGAEGGDQARLEAVAEGRPAGGPGVGLGLPALEGGGQADGEGDGDGPGATALLLAAAEEAGAEPDALADEQQAGAHRAVELVGAGGQGRDPQGVEVDRDPAHGLHGVGMDRDAVLARPAPPAGRPAGGRRSRCWPASGWPAGSRGGRIPPSARRRRSPRDRARARSTANPAASSRATGSAIAGCSRALATRWPGPRSRSGQAEDRQVVGLGPPGGEDDLARVGPQHPGDRLLGTFPGPTRRAAGGVAALGVARGQPVRPHRLEHLGIQRRRRVVVEVDPLHGPTRPRRNPSTDPIRSGRSADAAERQHQADEEHGDADDVEGARARARRPPPSARSRAPGRSGGRAARPPRAPGETAA